MQKYAKICSDTISISPVHLYAFICTKYAKTCMICKRESHMQKLQKLNSSKTAKTCTPHFADGLSPQRPRDAGRLRGAVSGMAFAQGPAPLSPAAALSGRAEGSGGTVPVTPSGLAILPRAGDGGAARGQGSA